MIVWYSAPPASAPEPRLTARSMLSFGTEDFFAFWLASYRVGFPPGSPPPIRAATSMFLISFAKSLPRFASMTAFLCFVVAHLEWPDMANPTPRTYCADSEAADQLGEVAVQPGVPGHLRMERRGQQPIVANRDDPTRGRARAHRRQYLHVPADAFHPRCADEHGVVRRVERGELQVRLERVHLPPERVPPYGDIQSAERLLALDPAGDLVGQLVHRGRLATRQHHRVHPLQLRRTPYRDSLHADLVQHRHVLAHVALQSD